MRQRELVLTKLQQLKNYVVAQRSLISTARSREEIFQHIERIESKIQEIEVLVNRENQDWN